MKRKSILSILLALAMVLSICMPCTVFAAGQQNSGGLIQQIQNSQDIQYKKQNSITNVKNADNVKLVAHRGLGTAAPENTIPAFEEAAKVGFKYVETDIHATKDGVWVISHDRNLKRMTGYDGEIPDMTLEEVRSHPITNGANVDKYPGLLTPTLAEFLQTCRNNGLTPVIELKDLGLNQPFDKLVEQIKEYGFEDTAIVISFYTQPLASVRRLDPKIHEQYLSNTTSQRTVMTARFLQNCGIDVNGYGALLMPASTLLSRLEGVETNVWTVDDPTSASLLMILDSPAYLTTNTLLPAQN